MMRIVHISDLHFGREQPKLVAALSPQIHALEPDLVVVTGDLTQRARRRELAAAAEWIGGLPQPVLVVPGNHDIPGFHPGRFLSPWRGWHQHLVAGLDPVVETDELLALGVNTARSWGPYLDWSRGRFGAAQIDRLASRFAAARGRFRLLAAHHPVLLTPSAARRGLVGRSALALERLGRAGLDLVLGGHVHLAYAEAVGGIVIAHAGTTLSNRLVGEPNSFNLIAGDQRLLSVEQWWWIEGAFSPVARDEFRRSEGGWQRHR